MVFSEEIIGATEYLRYRRSVPYTDVVITGYDCIYANSLDSVPSDFSISPNSLHTYS